MRAPADTRRPPALDIDLPPDARILLIRLSAIGDVVMASPLARVLRDACPEGRLTWLVQRDCAAVAGMVPAVDRVLIWDRAEWGRLWREGRYRELRGAIRGLVRALRAERFDLALDTQGLLKSAVWARASGAPVRVGLGSREGSRHLVTHALPRGGDAALIGSEYRFLAQALGLPVGTFRMELRPPPEAQAAAEALLRGRLPEGPFAVLCPFTTRPQKHWIAQRWSALARRLHTELGLRVLMLGGPGDRGTAGRIREAAGDALVDVTGGTSLPQAAAVLARARIAIGVDTGLTHMAIAQDIPTVALFGSTLPYRETGRESVRILYEPLPCSPCRRSPTCHGAYTCMHALEVDRVMTAARELGGAGGRRAP